MLWCAAGFLAAVVANGVEIPDYARRAVAAFNPDVPEGWAYTLTTHRNDQQIVERFDPALPPEERWKLVQNNGRTPTTEEISTYELARRSGKQSAPQAAFTAYDLAPDTLALVREDEHGGEFTIGFRPESAHGDRMLNHLDLHLFIDRPAAAVTRYTLELREPYSPVLAVKMYRLQVESTFSPPAADRPSLPARNRSDFTGRMFLFFSVSEKLELTFSDFAKR